MCGIHAPFTIMESCLRYKFERPWLIQQRKARQQQQLKVTEGLGQAGSIEDATEDSFAGADEKENEIEEGWQDEIVGDEGAISSLPLQPIYIVMLREPWARFQSEINHAKLLKNSNSNSLDDSSITLVGLADWQVIWRSKDPTIVDSSKIALAVGLPDSFMVQNRQLKMVGGAKQDFSMRFQAGRNTGSDSSNGTRWRGEGSEEVRKKLLSAAIGRLAEQNSVFIAIAERYAETVCMLQILYGHLYTFDWEQDVHSHSNSKAFTAKEPRGGVTDAQYAQWELINRKDIQLYEAATVMFERQFAASLGLLRRRLRGGEITAQKVPFCQQFL